MVRSGYDHGTIMVRTWYDHGTIMVRSWYDHGTNMVRSWYDHGTIWVRFRVDPAINIRSKKLSCNIRLTDNAHVNYARTLHV